MAAEHAAGEVRTLREQMSLMKRENDEQKNLSERLKDEIKQLEEELRTKEILSTHALSEFRSRVLAFLKSLDERYLSPASEAAELSPPRAVVIKERIEIAQQSLQKEIEWLKSLA
jgi:hypothetical protein